MSEEFTLAGQVASSGECVVTPRADLVESEPEHSTATESQES